MRRHVLLTLVQIILAALKLLAWDAALRELLCQSEQLADRFDSRVWLAPIEVIVSTEIRRRAEDDDANDVDESLPAWGKRRVAVKVVGVVSEVLYGTGCVVLCLGRAGLLWLRQDCGNDGTRLRAGHHVE